MVLLRKATNGIATRAEGAFANCGPGGDGYELSYNCQGPACSSLDINFQNIVCHKDGSSTLICSNDVKCQPGTSSYQSNFTFSQNEPDPWSPVMENEPDTWVHQDQHVLLGSCAKFSLTSDGTKEGTRLDDEGQADFCPNVQRLSMSAVDSNIVGATGSNEHPHAGATSRPLVFAGIGSRHITSKSYLLLAFLLTTMLLLPGSQASAANPRLAASLRRNDVHLRAVSDKIRGFAGGFGAELAQSANDQGTTGEAFAHDLVTGVISSVCREHFEGASPSTFSPGIVKDCVASIYGGGRLLQPATQFLAVLGASLLCDYIVSETYPNGQDFLPDGCEGLQDLVNNVPAGDSTAELSVPTAPSSQATRIASLGALPAIAPSFREQAPSRPVSALSQAKKPHSDVGSSDTAKSHTLSASRSAPGEEHSMSGLDTDKTTASALIASTLISESTFSADSSLTILPTRTGALRSLVSSSQLPLMKISPSELASPQLLLATTAPSGSSAAETLSSDLPISGVIDVDSTTGMLAAVTPQNAPLTTSSQPAQTTFGTPGLTAEQKSDVLFESTGSNAAYSSVVSLELLTSVPSSRTQPVISEAGDLAVSKESALTSAITLQMNPPVRTPRSSSASVPATPFLASLPSGTPTRNTPFSRTPLPDAPSFITNLVSVSSLDTSSSNVVPSNVPLGSYSTSGLLASELGPSVRTQPDIQPASLNSASPTSVTASRKVVFDISYSSLSLSSTISVEPNMSSKVSLTMTTSSTSIKQPPNDPTASELLSSSKIYASVSSTPMLGSTNNLEVSTKSTLSSMDAVLASTSPSRESSLLSFENLPTGTQDSETSIKNSNTPVVSASIEVPSTPSGASASSRISSSTKTSLEPSGSSLVMSFPLEPSTDTLIPDNRPSSFNLVSTNAPQVFNPGTSSALEAASTLNPYPVEPSLSSFDQPSVDAQAVDSPILISNASKLRTLVEDVNTVTATTNTISYTSTSSESIIYSPSGSKPFVSNSISILSTTSDMQQTGRDVSRNSNLPSTPVTLPTSLPVAIGTVQATYVMSPAKTSASEDLTSTSVLVGSAPMSSLAISGYQDPEKGSSSSVLSETVFSSSSEPPATAAPGATGTKLIASSPSKHLSGLADEVSTPNSVSATKWKPSIASKASSLDFPIVTDARVSAKSSPNLGELLDSPISVVRPTFGVSAPVSVKTPSKTTGDASLSLNDTRISTSDTRLPQDTFSSLLPILGHELSTPITSALQNTALHNSRVSANISSSTSTKKGLTQLTDVSQSLSYASSTFNPSNMSPASAKTVSSRISPTLPTTVVSLKLSPALVFSMASGRSFPSVTDTPLTTTTSRSSSLSSASTVSVVSVSILTSTTLNSDGGECEEGYNWNGFMVCRPPVRSTSFKTSAQRTILAPTTVVSFPKLLSSITVSSASALSIVMSEDGFMCPPGLPDACNGGCFNTRSEHNHCGGCGRYCSGNCIDGSCFSSSTQPSVQPISTRRTVTTSSSSSASSMRPLTTSTAELVALAIVKGLVGPRQAYGA